MRIDLALTGLAPSITGLGRIAGGYRSIARAQKLVSDSVPKFSAPSDAQIRRASGFASSLREVAAAYREVAKAQQGVTFPGPISGRGASVTTTSVSATASPDSRPSCR